MEKLKHSLECLTPPFDDGQTKKNLSSSLLHMVKDFTNTTNLLEVTGVKHWKTTHLAKPFIYEFLHQNKKTILNDKEIFFLTNFQDTKCIKTLDQESTLSDRGCCLSYNILQEEWSQKLWLPQKTNCVEQPLISFNGSCTKGLQNSWFSTTVIKPKETNGQTNSFPLSKYFVVDGMAKEDTQKTTLKTRMIKLNPTKEQRKRILQFANDSRFVYNECVKHINDELAENRTFADKFKLRQMFVTAKKNEYFKDKEWLLQTPKCIRQQAIFECVDRYNTLLKSGPNLFDFKKKKEEVQTIGIEKAFKYNKEKQVLSILTKTIGNIRFFKGNTKRRDILKVLEQANHECKIKISASGNMYLLVPVEIRKKEEKFDKRPVVSIDPGIRTFYTTYDLENKECFKIGDEANSIIANLYKEVDLIKEKLSKCDKQKKKRFYRRCLIKQYEKIKNKCNEFSHKVSNWLSARYSTIVVPQLNVRDLVSRKEGARTLRVKSVRELLSIGHYNTLMKLKEKCKDKGSVLLIVKEFNTTRTCGKCGHLKTDIGSAKEWTCEKCGMQHDRDVNAARNILIRNMKRKSI